MDQDFSSLVDSFFGPSTSNLDHLHRCFPVSSDSCGQVEKITRPLQTLPAFPWSNSSWNLRFSSLSTLKSGKTLDIFKVTCFSNFPMNVWIVCQIQTFGFLHQEERWHGWWPQKGCSNRSIWMDKSWWVSRSKVQMSWTCGKTQLVRDAVTTCGCTCSQCMSMWPTWH